MNAQDIIKYVETAGMELYLEGERLKYRSPSQPDPEIIEKIKAHKSEILQHLKSLSSLTSFQRTESFEDSCPSYWKNIPILPPRGQKAEMVDKDGKGKRYRIALFGKWYILRFNPNISETSIEITCTIPKRRMFADLSEFYRWAWAEHYYSELTFREGN